MLGQAAGNRPETLTQVAARELRSKESPLQQEQVDFYGILTPQGSEQTAKTACLGQNSCKTVQKANMGIGHTETYPSPFPLPSKTRDTLCVRETAFQYISYLAEFGCLAGGTREVLLVRQRGADFRVGEVESGVGDLARWEVWGRPGGCRRWAWLRLEGREEALLAPQADPCPPPP